jgi:DNA-binding MarR family transcriptional regulator
MSIRSELKYPNPIDSPEHEAILSIVMTAGVLVKEGDALLRPFGLTETQFNVLMVLRYQADPDGIAQTELSERLLVNRSNVTGLVDRMEEAGWVERTDHGTDRRRKLVVLTRRGVDLLERVSRVYLRRVEATMAGLSRKDQATLCRMLEAVRDNVRSQ